MNDGDYPVRLAEAKVFNDGGEDEFLELTWETMDDTHTTFTQNVPRKVNGVYNAYGANVVRLWATEWNMLSYAELTAHAAEYAAKRPLIAVIRDDNLVVVRPGEVEKVGGGERVGGGGGERVVGGGESSTPQPKYYSNTPTKIKLVIDRDVLLRLPKQIEQNAVSAKAIFDAMTEQTDREDASLVWTKLAERIGPMQIDFTPEQWGEMIEKIRNLKSCEFTLKK